MNNIGNTKNSKPCIVFIIPAQMYSGFNEVQRLLAEKGYYSEEHYTSAESEPDSSIELKEILEKHKNIAAVVYPSSNSFIFKRDWDSWQTVVYGRTNIERYLELFSQKNIKTIGMNMNELGAFEDSLGFYGEQKYSMDLIFKEL